MNVVLATHVWHNKGPRSMCGIENGQQSIWYELLMYTLGVAFHFACDLMPMHFHVLTVSGSAVDLDVGGIPLEVRGSTF